MEQFLDEVRKEYDDTQNNQNKEKIINKNKTTLKKNFN
jgi:hypothetical protein